MNIKSKSDYVYKYKIVRIYLTSQNFRKLKEPQSLNNDDTATNSQQDVGYKTFVFHLFNEKYLSFKGSSLQMNKTYQNYQAYHFQYQNFNFRAFSTSSKHCNVMLCIIPIIIKLDYKTLKVNEIRFEKSFKMSTS